MDCIPQLQDIIPGSRLACQMVGSKGNDPLIEIWYYKNQMDLAVYYSDTINNTIFSLNGY